MKVYPQSRHTRLNGRAGFDIRFSDMKGQKPSKKYELRKLITTARKLRGPQTT